jgi:hypothetical protein
MYIGDPFLFALSNLAYLVPMDELRSRRQAWTQRGCLLMRFKKSPWIEHQALVRPVFLLDFSSHLDVVRAAAVEE